jgi:hypothetical protein
MIRRNWGVLVLVVFVVVAAGLIIFKPDAGASAPASTMGEGKYQWRFVEWGSDEVPQTQVTLLAAGQSHMIGTYDGSCAVMEEDYLEYEKSKVVCWFAGGGNEIGVFEEPGQVVVRVGEVDEGASGIQGFRGNFTLVKTLR